MARRWEAYAGIQGCAITAIVETSCHHWILRKTRPKPKFKEGQWFVKTAPNTQITITGPPAWRVGQWEYPWQKYLGGEAESYGSVWAEGCIGLWTPIDPRPEKVDDGYELTHEVRLPKQGEYYFFAISKTAEDTTNMAFMDHSPTARPSWILRKKPRAWRRGQLLVEVRDPTRVMLYECSDEDGVLCRIPSGTIHYAFPHGDLREAMANDLTRIQWFNLVQEMSYGRE